MPGAREQLQELIRKAQRGDNTAFEELMECYYAPVFGLLCKWTGHWQDAEDLTQETFLKAYKYLRSFRPGQEFKNWLYQIALNLAHGHHARRQGQPLNELDETIQENMYQLPANAEEAVSRHQMIQQIYRALPLLTARERSVLVLKTLEGMENNEVARVLEISETTVRRFYGLARRKIIDRLSDSVARTSVPASLAAGNNREASH